MDSNKIHLLDINTANQIAAGEVVERPLSVVKELLENSLDAGATIIDIEILEGGSKYIRITDNGCGMSRQDATMSIVRHATSKIRHADDLMKIHTLGFRGEALPSIASVTKFKLVTRTLDAPLATSILVEGGELIEVAECGAAVGTTITIEDLFYNLPARKKFLKTNNTESRYINDIVTKIALAHPEVKITLTNNKQQSILTVGNGNLLDTIFSIYGEKVSTALLPLEFISEEVTVTGYVGRPSILKSSRSWQMGYVNGRSINSKLIYRAIDQAYKTQIPNASYPFALVSITINPALVDINVHPQKTEVKFSDESLVFKAIFRSLSTALLQPLQKIMPNASAPVAQTAPPTNIISKNLSNHSTTKMTSDYSPSITPIKTAMTTMDYPAPKSIYQEEVSIWKTPDIHEDAVVSSEDQATSSVLMENFSTKHTPDYHATLAEPLAPTSMFVAEEASAFNDKITAIAEIARLYIIAKTNNKLYIIDQHAAHERIIFDRLAKKQMLETSQVLLIPQFVELGANEIDLLADYADYFAELAVVIDVVGPTTIKVSCIPHDINAKNVGDFIIEALKILQTQKKPEPQDFRLSLIQMLSCKAAVKSGDTLTLRAQQELIDQLLLTDHPFTCPHGRPVIAEFDTNQLGKLFKR